MTFKYYSYEDPKIHKSYQHKAAHTPAVEINCCPASVSIYSVLSSWLKHKTAICLETCLSCVVLESSSKWPNN